MPIRTLLPAAAAAFATSVVAAGPTTFDVASDTRDDLGLSQEQFALNYQFGTLDWLDDVDDGLPGSLHISVTSGPSLDPDFDFEITLDYANYDLAFFTGFGAGLHDLDLANLEPAGIIGEAVALDAFGDLLGAGSLTTDGFSIGIETTAQRILDGGESLTIRYRTIPAPAALALFGLAGAVSRRRRG